MRRPIADMYQPPFWFFCARCGRSNPSYSGITGQHPFSYVGWCCQTPGEREAVRLEANRQFDSLPPAVQQDVRVRTMGAAAARRIGLTS